jgi:hypothetical protein
MPWFPFRVRHPFYPGFPATPAVASAGPREGLAGTFQELRNAALSGARARHAAFILTREGAWPAREERDELWRLFQVPAYAIWLDGEGKQLGWECEAQDGLHVAEGWRGCLAGFRLETEPCACGRPGARLVRNGSEEAAVATTVD